MQHYVPLEHIDEVSLGESVIIFSGTGQNAQLHTGIVSQKGTSDGVVNLVRISVPATSITGTSMVFIEGSFAGFTQPYSNTVLLPNSTFVAKAIQVIQAQDKETKDTTTQDTEVDDEERNTEPSQ